MKYFILDIEAAKIAILIVLLLTGCMTHHSPNGKAFPRSWGKPPEIQTKDYRPLPHGYGHGSSTLYHWIMENQK